MAEATDQIGTEVLFENDRIRVWDMTLEPGESTQLHRHDHDYIFVYVTPDNKLQIDVPDGPTMRNELPYGTVAYWEVGAGDPPPHYTHMATNVGDTTHRQILVEFLGESASDEPQGPFFNER
jgi:hypothetical protein